jgi:hypothetical protein
LRIAYSPATATGPRRRARVAAATRQRRSLRLTIPPKAITSAPIQIHEISGL